MILQCLFSTFCQIKSVSICYVLLAKLKLLAMMLPYFVLYFLPNLICTPFYLKGDKVWVGSYSQLATALYDCFLASMFKRTPMTQ